jgi:lantibiotic modifying enzyme
MFLEAAARLADRLCRDAVWDADQCNWLGWAMTPVGHTWALAYRAQPPNLYDGTSGIALFLARVYAQTADPVVRATALGAITCSQRRADALAGPLRSAFYSGQLGMAYACAEVGRAVGAEPVLARGVKMLDDLREVGPADGGLDICSGSAGAIQALLHLAREVERPGLVDLAVRHGDHLLATARKTDDGWSWETMPGAHRDLLGYAHGTAGIAAGLLELWAATREARFRDAALAAVRYERRHFDKGSGNWPDYRTVDTTKAPPAPAFTLAWCHGAPGVGLSRTRAHALLPEDPTFAEEVQAALQTTVTHFAATWATGPGNFSLCHGAGGNAELFIAAAEVFARPDLLAIAQTVGRNGIARHHANPRPWPCGVADGRETPNLMLGLAGVGYFYLRLYDPQAVPSVLLLTTPSHN